MAGQFRKIQCVKLSTNFKEATQIVTEPIPTEIRDDEILVQNYFVGINASDINYTAGRYRPGVNPPFDCGFESVGYVRLIGKRVQNINLNDAVAVTGYGCFAEYQVVKANKVLPIPFLAPQVLPLLVSGLTASIALERVGELEMHPAFDPKRQITNLDESLVPASTKCKSKKTVLVTAAAGGTGTFAVQLAKAAGHHVIGTCSSDDKAAFLRRLGCDRPINYRKEDLGQVLHKEYPNGVDVVYESVGGRMFEQAVDNLAVHGRVIVIGMISSYQDQSAFASGGGSSSSSSLPMKLLGKSASIRGFFLNHFFHDFARHTVALSLLLQEGKVESVIDDAKSFRGLEQVGDAISHLYTGTNRGKVIVDISPKTQSRL